LPLCGLVTNKSCLAVVRGARTKRISRRVAKSAEKKYMLRLLHSRGFNQFEAKEQCIVLVALELAKTGWFCKTTRAYMVF